MKIDNIYIDTTRNYNEAANKVVQHHNNLRESSVGDRIRSINDVQDSMEHMSVELMKDLIGNTVNIFV